MTHLGIDCRFASGHFGIGRYIRELLPHVLANLPSDVKVTLFVKDAKESWLSKLPSTIHYSLFTIHSSHYSLSEQLFFPEHIKKSGVNVFWSPHFNVPLLCPVPFVVTIHDLILHRYPNQAGFIKRMAYHSLMKHAVQNAKHIIAVSHFTASEIENVYGKEVHERITVIPEGVSPHFHRRTKEESAEVLDRYGITMPFYLYVGNAKEHKNLSLLFEAFEDVQDSNASLVLVSSGKELHRLSLRDRSKVISHVTEDELASLYSLAKAFVTPSLYEGFCLPVAEAAACGCPVIAVRGTAIPEVAPSSSALVEPTVAAFRNAMDNPPRASDSPPLSWEVAGQKTAQQLLTQISYLNSHN